MPTTPSARVIAADEKVDRMSKALTASWDDVWLLDGVRTPFVDYNGGLAQISPIDLGIKAATRSVRALRRVAGRRRHGHHRQHGAGELRCVPDAAPHRALCRRADRDAGAHGAARLRHRHRGADAGGRHDHASRRRSRALRRHRVDEPQPDRRLHAPRRLPHGAGRVQGLPLGGADGRLRQGHHGRHGGKPRAAIPDHATRGGRLRGALVRSAP